MINILTCNWQDCVLVEHEYQIHVALCQNILYPNHI